MLSKVLNEYDWQPWKFHTLPKGLKNDRAVVDRALNTIEKELGITNLEDFYRISQSQLDQIGLGYFISQLGGLRSALRTYRPSFAWDETKFADKSNSKKQK